MGAGNGERVTMYVRGLDVRGIQRAGRVDMNLSARPRIHRVHVGRRRWEVGEPLEVRRLPQ